MVYISGLSEHKSNQSVHGDWKYGGSSQSGESLRESVRCTESGEDLSNIKLCHTYIDIME